MTAISTIATEDINEAPRSERDVMPGGVALSAALHVGLFALIIVGLPTLFRPPPPEEMPIAVELVNIGPKTLATHPNPYRPMPHAKPEPATAPPAPIPEPKPMPPTEAAAEPPPSAASAPPPTPTPRAKPEVKPAAPPPPPKPLLARAPVPVPEPKPKPEPPQAHPSPQRVAKADAAAFDKLLNNLADKPPERQPAPGDFDALLKNLTRTQMARAEEKPPVRPVTASAAAPSSQPHAPLGSVLTASQIDLLRQQIERCWDVPAGARDAQDLVVEIKASVNRDGTVQQAAIVDTGRYASDAFFRAAADSAKRAVLNPQCTGPENPLKLPPEQYEAWHNLDLFFNPKDLL